MNDVRFALKSLAKSPGFTLIALVTLALGIGANTAAFSILNALLLRPLPYPESRQLERIYRTSGQNARGGISPADYLDLRAQMGGYGEVAAYASTGLSVSQPGEPADIASGLRVSANLFSTLGTRPQLGRGFRADEEIVGRHHVVVISHRYWQDRFAGDAGVIGRTIRVDGEPHEIVGVLPASLNDWRHLGPYDVFQPLALSAKERADRTATSLRLIARRSGGVTHAQGRAFVADFGRRLAAAFPGAHAGTTWRTLPIYDSVIPENAKGIVGMLVGLSGFVLLIACSNLANLLLARTVARSRELAVRSALGASRVRLLRPLLVESLLLALAGGACAVQVALWVHDWLNRFGTRSIGDPLTFVLDWRVLGWTVLAGVCTAVFFGVGPALFTLRLDLNGALKSGARGSTATRGHKRLRQVLIAGQFALAMVLLTGAAMFVRGLREWNGRNFGWDASPLVTGTVLLPEARYAGNEELTAFQRLALGRVRALPGVASASLSWSMPFFGLGETRKYVVAGRDVPPPGHEPMAATNGITPGYFETVRTPLLDGRAFDDRDTMAAPRVYIINETMARALFGGTRAVGQRIARAGASTMEWGEVVGVAADVRPPASDRLAVNYQVYQPMPQEPRRESEMAVRADGIAPASLVEGIRTAIMSLDPDLPVRRLQPAASAVAQAGSYQKIIASLLSLMAALGLGLASLGVYGVVARAVAQRTGEFGIRLAVGARPSDISRLVLTSGATLAAIGCAAGVLGAFVVARLIAAGFPGLRPNSALTLAGATAVLILVAQLASYMPARSASRVSPTEALRAE